MTRGLTARRATLHIAPRVGRELSGELSLNVDASRRRTTPHHDFTVTLILVLIASYTFTMNLHLNVLSFVKHLTKDHMSGSTCHCVARRSGAFSSVSSAFSIQLQRATFSNGVVFTILSVTPIGRTALLVPLSTQVSSPIKGLRLSYYNAVRRCYRGRKCDSA